MVDRGSEASFRMGLMPRFVTGGETRSEARRWPRVEGQMDVAEALRQLPAKYALALRLRQVGADEQLIADCLDVEPSAAAALLTIAQAKLDNALRPQTS
jgi:DNA-directed RNA polymerase specialized sigma24 family protein